MNARLEGRLAKLEAVLGVDTGDARRLTDDELGVELLDVSRRIAADPEAPADVRAASQRHVEEVEAAIRWQAALGNHPTYAAHLEHLAEVILDFTPAIVGSIGLSNGSTETGDLDKPRAMMRRAALRAPPDIAALIAAGARETVTLEHAGQFVAGRLPDGAMKQLRDRYPASARSIRAGTVGVGVAEHEAVP